MYNHVRNGIVPAAQIVPGMPKTTWVSDAQGIRCTQIVTNTQIISLNFNYDATCYLNEFYSTEQPLPVGKMLGLWTLFVRDEAAIQRVRYGPSAALGAPHRCSVRDVWTSCQC